MHLKETQLKTGSNGKGSFMSNLEKWKDICRNAENVASEILRCEEAKADLTAEEMRVILHWSGDDDYVYVTDNKEILPDKRRRIA